VATQIPHQLGASIHSNAFTKIMFHLANGVDIDFMARSMGIREPEQIQYCHRLKKREILVKFSGRYQEPFLAYVPEMSIFNGEISDSQIRHNNERILSSIPIVHQSRPIDITRVKTEEQKSQNATLSNEEKAFLMDIYNRPYISITERYDTIDLGG
jgi:hypothetical protein